MSDQDAAGAAFNFKLYRYDPSLPAAIVAVIVFAVLTTLHTWRLWRARAFYFTPFVIGGVCKPSLVLLSSSSTTPRPY